jgi:hypothetical protein
VLDAQESRFLDHFAERDVQALAGRGVAAAVEVHARDTRAHGVDPRDEPAVLRVALRHGLDHRARHACFRRVG